MPREVILGFGISIGDYIARRNGAMDYLVIDKEGEALMADFFAKIDTTIMGSTCLLRSPHSLHSRGTLGRARLARRTASRHAQQAPPLARASVAQVMTDVSHLMPTNRTRVTDFIPAPYLFMRMARVGENVVYGRCGIVASECRNRIATERFPWKRIA